MANIKRANASGITKSGAAIADVPDAPTIGTATGGQAAATVTFTPATTGGTPTTYTATSSPGSITGTASSSPITVSGLTNNTAYTFTVTATNSTGTSAASSASNSVTPVSLGDMDPIAMVEVGSSGSSTITFSSIPSTYTHLQIRGVYGMASTNSATKIQFNSDTANNYSYHYITGNGASTYTGASAPRDFMIITDETGNVMTTSPTAFVIDILDYTNTSKYKTIRNLVGWDGNGSGKIKFVSGSWRSTTAVTTITITDYSSANFTQYSHFALYGIKGA